MKNPWKALSKINPQRENGHREIANGVFQALIAQRMTGTEWAVIMAVIDKTYGFNKLFDRISYSQLAKATKYTRRGVIKALFTLEARRVVVVNHSSLAPEILFNKHYDTWGVVNGSSLGGSEPQFTGVVNGSSPEVVNGSSPTKEIRKETIKRKKDIVPNPKKTDPAIKIFLDWWCKTWGDQFGEKYTVKGDKEGTLIKGLLKNHLIERLKELAKEFMKSNDPFVIKSGYTIGVFASQVNRLISTAKKAAPAKQTKSGIPKKELDDWKGSKAPLPKEVKVLVDNLKTKWTEPTGDTK